MKVGATGHRPEKKFLRTTKLRIFLTCWILYSAHFATNIVREHYPAFSIVDHGTFKVDEYLGFHSDIFLHSDGHAYIGNNVAGSLIAAIPLFVFDPALDFLEAYGKTQVAQAGDNLEATYQINKPNRKKFFKLVKENGLHLRFGGATVVTSVFLMAPLSAFFVVFMFSVLLERGVLLKRAVWLSFLFAFGTPIFFRTAHLNHNMFVMIVVFISFYLIWNSLNLKYQKTNWSYMAAGFLAGGALALDYAGVVPLLALACYLFFSRAKESSIKEASRDLVVFGFATIPPILFLMYSQWSMYGHPLYPGQYWMPDVNFTDLGWRGLSWPTLDLYFLNLFDPKYGMFAFGPLLIAGFIPSFFYKDKRHVLPRRERRFIAIFIFVFLTFCAANQYSRMQFNTGFRYLLPIVPFVFLLACEHLNGLSTHWLGIISVPLIFHSWVLSMFRESVPVSWSSFLTEGVQLPWLTVLKLTNQNLHETFYSNIFLLIILAICGVLIFFIWKFR